MKSATNDGILADTKSLKAKILDFILLNFNKQYVMKSTISAILVLLLSLGAFSQSSSDTAKAFSILKNRGEVILKFPKTPELPLNKITLMVSISKIEKDSIEAYLNYNQFQKFLELNIPFRIIEKKSPKSFLKSAGSVLNFSAYPTFAEYVSMMDSFSKAFPSLCKVIEVGQSVKKRQILFARINTDTTQAKPSVMYSSTMHGDETGGYILMLHFINYLLNNYKKNLLVTKLVDSLDIWINPLANPDGTYFDSIDVWSATRFNANGVDLNRNFPDPVEGSHPDENPYQPETQAMMNLMAQHHFVLSANYHAGDEVVNYPWDSEPTYHVDSTWFIYISTEFADSAQKFGRTGYFTSVSPNGIIDGYYWYPVYGGRQDYMTYFRQGREVTIELDAITKTTPEDSLNNLWNYNYRSFLHYFEQALYGFHGYVFDSLTQKPVKAKIELVGHDDNSSFIYSDSLNGSFYRPVYTGEYNILVSAVGYESIELPNVLIQNNETKYFNFYLKAGKNSITEDIGSGFGISPDPCNNNFQITGLNESEKASLTIIAATGENVYSTFVSNNEVVNIRNLEAGIYFVQVKTQTEIFVKKIEIIH